MSSIGVMVMPADFRYKEVFLRGKPKHDQYDPFRIRHPGMEVRRRAKIFSPFDALKGFSDAVSSKNVFYQERIVLTPEDQNELNHRLQVLHGLTWNSRMAKSNQAAISVIYYEPCMDVTNEAFEVRGRYLKTSGICWNVDDEVTGTILVDNQRISFEDILRIDSPDAIFEEYSAEKLMWTE